jgi:hypothetical protein
MRVTEEPIDPEILESLAGAAGEAAELARIGVDAAPLEIVTAINDFVRQEQKEPAEDADHWDDRALPLGSLWGLQFVRQFGWQWANVTLHDHGDVKAMGVFSPDRSLAIYPFYFIFGCLENQAPVTILLAFNMLAEGKIPPLPANGYENVMEGVHHIVPPE